MSIKKSLSKQFAFLIPIQGAQLNSATASCPSWCSLDYCQNSIWTHNY